MKKLIIIVLVLAVVAYFGYKWYCKKQAEAQKAAAQKAPAIKIDTASQMAVVSDLANGLEPDLV